MFDLAVIGSGPAGLAVATAAGAQGLQVACVAPKPEAAWPNNYGLWLDELKAVGLGQCAAMTWPQARLRMRPGQTKIFERAYARVHNASLRSALLERGRVQFRAGRAQRIHQEADASWLTLEGGEVLQARLVVDASGAGTSYIQRRGDGATGAQVAYGQTVRAPGHGLPLHEMLLMDFSDPGLSPSDPVTFLYAMPLSPDVVFLEETVLVASPAPPISALKVCLQRRIDALGINVTEVLDEERCIIPMGGDLPAGPQRVVPFGAAAGMVHPATGYSLNRVLAIAPTLAETIARAIRAQPDDPKVAADAAWQVIWPDERRHTWALYRFGMQVLVELDRAQTQDFFSAFFAVRAETWSPYLAGTASLTRTLSTMAEVFSRASMRTRGRLMRHALGPSGLALLADLRP